MRKFQVFGVPTAWLGNFTRKKRTDTTVADENELKLRSFSSGLAQ
jgi:hypothetical protein